MATSKDSSTEKEVDPNTYCRLGHFLLLLNHFGKGMYFYTGCIVLDI